MKLEAKVAQLLTETSFVINAGSSQGVTKGSQVVIWEDRNVFDPDTREPLGTVRITVAVATINEVQDRLSVAQSAWDSTGIGSIVLGGTRARPRYRFTTGSAIDDNQVRITIGQSVTVDVLEEVPF